MRPIWTAAVIVGVFFSFTPVHAQRPQAPPQGRGLQARDGDLVIIDGDATVRVVRRRQANITALYNQTERWVIVMIDHASGGKPPDGGVDATYTFHDVSGWPLGERWSGAAIVDEYTLAGTVGGGSLGITTDAGLTQLLSPRDEGFRDPAAASVVAYRGSGHGGSGNRPFAETEAREIQQASRNAQTRASLPGGMSVSSGIEARVTGLPPSRPDGLQPVRVGSIIRTPTKLVHVDGVLPPAAAQAGVRGLVILEITIGPDGSVTDAKVLRSIPLLDEAALAAVRQWKYTPTLLNGVAVPVVITATVNFQ